MLYVCSECPNQYTAVVATPDGKSLMRRTRSSRYTAPVKELFRLSVYSVCIINQVPILQTAIFTHHFSVCVLQSVG